MSSRRPGLPSNPRCQLPSSHSFAHTHIAQPNSAKGAQLAPTAPFTRHGRVDNEPTNRSQSPPNEPPSFPVARLAHIPSIPSARPFENPKLEQRTDNAIITSEKNALETSPYPTPCIDQEAVSTLLVADGYNVWNRVAVAANSLTINVSKAWTSTVTSVSGEETPPGQDSHLIRAMKAYHISKADDLSDLPEWLFTERERRAGSRLQKNNANHDGAMQATPVIAQKAPSRSGGVPDTNNLDRPLKTTRLRGADRLKVMRDSRRGAGRPTAVAARTRVDTN